MVPSEGMYMDKVKGKFIYLAGIYPDKNVKEVATMLTGLPTIVINNTVWGLKDSGHIEIDKDNKVKILSPDGGSKYTPYDDSVMEIRSQILAVLGHLQNEEADLEEWTLTDWLAGYPPYDQLIAINMLEEEQLIATYTIEDEGSEYKFYTLFTNKDKQWGSKQFKVSPDKK